MKEQKGLDPEMEKDEITKSTNDETLKNRIEFDLEEMEELERDFELPSEPEVPLSAEEAQYRPYKVSKRMSQKE